MSRRRRAEAALARAWSRQSEHSAEPNRSCAVLRAPEGSWDDRYTNGFDVTGNPLATRQRMVTRLMQAKELTANGETATFALVFASGDEVIEELTGWCRAKGVTAARFTGVGALSSAVVAWLDWDQQRYREIPVDEQVELLALSGDVAEQDGQASIHAHVVLGKRDGSAWGGHLLKAQVRPTVELILDIVPSHLRKQPDRESGIPLIALSK